ncbi:MAG: hypothetical protein AAF467_04800 [Actinomycetota bacterium]
MRTPVSAAVAMLLVVTAACSGSITDDPVTAGADTAASATAASAPTETSAATTTSTTKASIERIDDAEGTDDAGIATPKLPSSSDSADSDGDGDGDGDQTAGSTSSSTSTTTTAEPPASTTTAPSTTATTTAPVPTGDSSNPIAVPVELLGSVASSGAARCKFVDLSSVPVPPNPGYVSETLQSQTLSGDEHWALSFSLMLYANCERQARGIEPFSMYAAGTQAAMQQTVLGISESHGRFGERADIAGGLAAEGHGGGPRPSEPIEHDGGEDDNGDGLWSAREIGRRSVSGNQSNDGAGLVDHGDAMTDSKFTCIFAAASLGQSVDHRVDVIIFYGNRC